MRSACVLPDVGSSSLAAASHPPQVCSLHCTAAALQAGKDLPLERHQGAYALQKQLMEGIAGDPHLAGLGAAAFRCAGTKLACACAQKAN